MKWYWVVSCDNTVGNPFVADSEDLKQVNKQDLLECKPIEDWDETAWLKASKAENDGVPDDVLQESSGIPVYSERLRLALENASIDGIQYLPVRVLRPNGSPIHGFSIANILHLVASLDFDRSDCEFFPADYFVEERRGTIRAIRRATLLRSALDGFHVFRLKEFRRRIYVSERFKEAFESGDFTGYSFNQAKVS